MGARSGADHPVQANSLQRPWPPRPLVHDILWPSLARRIRRVARFDVRLVASRERFQ